MFRFDWSVRRRQQRGLAMGRAGILVLCWTLAGCSCVDRTHPIFGDAVWRADENLSVTGNEATLAFGPTLIGTMAERRVAIANRGRADVTLTATAVSGVIAIAALDEVSLPGGAVHEWVVHFSPSADLELETATFDVTVDGAEEPRELKLHLRGTGAAVWASATGLRLPPCELEVRPGSLAFGLLQDGDEATRTVELWNRSLETCLVTSLELDALATEAGFELRGGRREVVSLSPGSSLALEVVARGTSVPRRFGPARGDLALQFTSGARLHELRGEGVAAQQVTESFVQPERQSVDVLFSVSSHGGGPWSWDAEDGGFGALEAGFRSRLAGAVAVLSDAGVDVHAGVIAGHWDREVWELTTPNPLLPPPPWVIGQLVSPPGASTTFTTASPSAGSFVSEAIRAASREGYFALTDQGGACFEAALRALTPPVDTTVNAGFRRPETPLVIVCQSFVGDISTHFRPGQYDDPWTPWTTALPVPYYWQRLASAAGGAHLLSVSSVSHVPGPPDCPDALGDFDGRFSEMAQLSGGRQIDTCDPDLAGAIQSLQQSIQAFSRRFMLRGQPAPTAPLIVRVEHTALPAGDWRYNVNLNAVEMVSAPNPGAQIEITYVPQCE